MSTTPVIRQYTYSHIASTLQHMNVNVARQFARHGISDWSHLDERDVIPVVDFIKAFEAGARATGEDRIGMLVAEKTGIDSFGDFGQAIQAGQTVFDALSIVCRFVHTQAPTLKFWLLKRENGVLICRKQLLAKPGIEQALTHVERYTMMFLLNVIRTGAGSEWTPSWVCLSTERDNLFGDWSEFGDATIEFSSSCSGIFVPNEILVRPLRDQSTDFSNQCIAAKSRLIKSQLGCDFVHNIRSLTSTLLKNRIANLNTVAEVSMLSKRTVQRQLAESGHSFKMVVDQARYDYAVKILEETDFSIAETSEYLGYEHPQHFIRAFRRWVGVTPVQYRETRLKMN